MKRKQLLTLLVSTLMGTVYAQGPLPVTNGLQMHLEAGSGYQDISGTSNDIWHDKLGLNDMETDPGSPDPIFVPDVGGTGFPGIHFDASAGTFMRSVNKPAFGFDYTDGVTKATIFVVRIADRYTTYPNQTIISISEDGIDNNEFALSHNEKMTHHHAGPWGSTQKDHQCSKLNFTNPFPYEPFPSEVNPPGPGIFPVLETGVYGTTTTELDYFINGIQSTRPLIVNSGGLPPLDYTAVDRNIYLGTRYDYAWPYGPIEFFDGDILEVLVYNRKLGLTAGGLSEVELVNEWLLEKYSILYDGGSGCKSPTFQSPMCTKTANLVIKYTGMSGSDCDFEAEIVTTPSPDYTNMLGSSFDWYQGLAWTQQSQTITFTIPNSTIDDPVEVKGYYSATTSGVPYCCEIYLRRTVSCISGIGYVNP